MLYFHSIHLATSEGREGNASILCTSTPRATETHKFLGTDVISRTQGKSVFGILSMIDPLTKKPMTAKSAAIIAASKLEPNAELAGVRLSDVPVKGTDVDKDGNKQDPMFWVEFE